MPNALRFKVYDNNGELFAQTRHIEDALLVAANIGESVIKDYWFGRRIVWREGKETISANESVDRCAQIVLDRVAQHRQEYNARHYPVPA